MTARAYWLPLTTHNRALRAEIRAMRELLKHRDRGRLARSAAEGLSAGRLRDVAIGMPGLGWPGTSIFFDLRPTTRRQPHKEN